jgi:hypothetical protein
MDGESYFSQLHVLHHLCMSALLSNDMWQMGRTKQANHIFAYGTPNATIEPPTRGVFFDCIWILPVGTKSSPFPMDGPT